MKKRSKLPHTSRVNEKILEYWEKFGRERDLEKFMRIYSPANSSGGHHSVGANSGGGCSGSGGVGGEDDRHTTTATTTSNSSCCATATSGDSEGSAMRVLFADENALPTTTVSSTNHNKRHKKQQRQTKNCAAAMDMKITSEIIIPIELEHENGNYLCASAEELCTPKKRQNTQQTQTQTPESAVKTHKRLEWDSLGDVGYKKSRSTSNLSTMERSLLKEIFLETQMPASSRRTSRPNASESDLKRLQSETSSTSMPPAPLASSTFVDAAVLQKNNGARLKTHTTQSCQTTASRLPKLHDQSAQTTQRRYLTENRSVQAATSSYVGSSATPSSFEFYSSRSSSTTATSADGSAHSELNRKNSQAYIEQIHQILAQHKTQRRTSIETINNATQGSSSSLANNYHKENIAVSTSSIASYGGAVLNKEQQHLTTDIDLGIQLLCSLVDARSLSNSQKKQLIRDIAKKLSCLDSMSNTSVSVSSNYNNGSKRKQSTQRHTTSQTKAEVQPTSTTAIETQTTEYTSETDDKRLSSSSSKRNSETTSDAQQYYEKPIEIMEPTEVVSATSILPKTSTSAIGITGTTTEQSLTSSTSSKEVITQKMRIEAADIQDANESRSTDMEQATMREWLNPMTQSEIEYEEKRRATNRRKSEREQQCQRKTQTAKKDKHNDSDTVARVTQLNWIENEIERLESLRVLISKISLQTSDVHDKENESQAADVAYVDSRELDYATTTDAPQEETTEEDHIYDSVNSGEQDLEIVERTTKQNTTEKTKVIEKLKSKEVGAALQKAFEALARKNKAKKNAEKIINIELSQEYNTERSYVSKAKPRRPPPPPPPFEHYEIIAPPQRPKIQTPTVPIDFAVSAKMPTTTTTTNVLRRRMPTPSSTTATTTTTPSRSSLSAEGASESVCSFVQQRKREFMEHYSKQKRQQLELLQQHQKQQQEQQQLLQEQHRWRQQKKTQQQKQHQQQQQHCNVCKHCNCQHCQHHLHQQQQPQQHHVATTKATCYCTIQNFDDAPHVYYQVVPPPPAPPTKTTKDKIKRKDTNMNAPPSSTYCTTTSNHTPNANSSDVAVALQQNTNSSASSMFCISSDMSIPMGVSNSIGGTTTTTTTTTHQYDDVAAGVCLGEENAKLNVAGVGVQTGGSMRHTNPIFGAESNAKATKLTTEPYRIGDQLCQTACVQVRPRCIAYVIEFPDKQRKRAAGGAQIDFDSNNNNVNANFVVSSSSATAMAPVLSLKDHLQRSRPQFCEHADERKLILNKMQMLREERRRELENIVANSSFNSLDRRLNNLPPAVTSRLRLFSTREMKAMTSKRCEVLPEVLERQRNEREERYRRGNRYLRDVFNRRLQRRVRNGKLTLNHSRTII